MKPDPFVLSPSTPLRIDCAEAESKDRTLSRREFLKHGGALVVSFSLAPAV